MIKWGYDRSASNYFPFLLLGNPANAGPAIFLHWGEVLEALEVNRYISSFLFGSLFADGVGFVDIIDASDFKIVGAISSECKGNDSQ